MDLNREPVAVRAAIVAAVTAVVELAVILGWDISPEVKAAIIATTSAVGGLVAIVWIRPTVTPVDDPRDHDGHPLTSDDDEPVNYEDDDDIPDLPDEVPEELR